MENDKDTLYTPLTHTKLNRNKKMKEKCEKYDAKQYYLYCIHYISIVCERVYENDECAMIKVAI